MDHDTFTPPPPILGPNLRRARRARGISLRALGAAVGVSGMCIFKYEHGETYPSAAMLCALARAVGVPVECLMSERCHVPPPPEPAPKTRIGRARWLRRRATLHALRYRREAAELRASAVLAVGRCRSLERERRALLGRIAALEAQIAEARRLHAAGCGDAMAALVVERVVELDGEEVTYFTDGSVGRRTL